MTETLPSNAERLAEEACKLNAFDGINLLSVRRDVKELLQAIGTGEIFDEYTRHDITHIDAMLEMLDWVVPDRTKREMTPGDWLLVVLSIYFHDLGMIVTKEEYKNRDVTRFNHFKSEVLLTEDDNGRDYLERINEIERRHVDTEKFLYQEFVRYYHALRVKNWIIGSRTKDFGDSSKVQDEVERILGGLSPSFRKDLALVCESHHLNDLENLEKYHPSRPYGTKPSEAANVQYAALLLRTVDLLHVTSDRTPSMTFRIIDPRDPVSQREWAKQGAVVSIRPRPNKKEKEKEKEKEGRSQAGTVEVHALFTEGEGYFGLISYLRFAEEQLALSHKWATQAQDEYPSAYEFPWNSIDTTNVRAEGFLAKQFKFSIDQEKILDLLTGHTLYNDSDVVVREILQNAIDAVRLQHGENARDSGSVWIRWDPKQRVLEVGDNGTGMTQEIIEKNLLRAGSSRYQDPKFRTDHPGFNPISRFGIGVMSAFMVADHVEITTSHKNDAQARHLTLRSVHGKYLVRLLEKSALPAEIEEHGTIVRLTVRPSARIGDVEETARQWAVIPECKITCSAIGKDPVRIGYSSVKEALLDFALRGHLVPEGWIESGKVTIEEVEMDGFSIAYAARKNDFFKVWEFVEAPARTRRMREFGIAETAFSSGVLVEGIRVENGSPGFSNEENTILALCNSTGPSAPRTDVARSRLENTPERQRMLEKIYKAYSAHIERECNSLEKDHHHSLTWACNEAQHLSGALSRGYPTSQHAMNDALRRVPMFTIERDSLRSRVSYHDIDGLERIHTRHGNVSRHVEALLREMPADKSANALLDFMGYSRMALPADAVSLCSDLSSFVRNFLLDGWEIADFAGIMEHRSFNVSWVKSGQILGWSHRWHPSQVVALLRNRSVRVAESNSERYRTVRLPVRRIEATGFSENYIGAMVGGEVFLFSSHPWEWAVEEITKNSATARAAVEQSLAVLSYMIALVTEGTVVGKLDELSPLYAQLSRSDSLGFSLARFQETCSQHQGKELFDSSRWTRSQSPNRFRM
ncbi:ATP-binding protein [Streptomyces sp. Tu 4128]|uniref:HD domain-containing protein n=1 Tax=Streptomyces sp. Tu 4128 TaxID=1120314 RepID=UPI0013CE63C2|nr:ATP-binding protein [Streptomyces sp. Tu 4128]